MRQRKHEVGWRLKDATRAHKVDHAPRVAVVVVVHLGARALEVFDRRLAPFRCERRRVVRHLLARWNGEGAAGALYEDAHGCEKARAARDTARTDEFEAQALVTRLAEDILAKSHALNGLVDSMPGMGRTREEQMRRIEELMGENRNLEEELVAVYQEAEETRDALRKRLRDVTSAALGIEEEG